MRTIDKMAAQGDLLIRRVDEIPDGVEPQAPDGDGRHVVAHSETGHHHYFSARHVQRFRAPDDELVSFLRVEGEYADLIHARSYDTHETLRVPRGTYEIRRQREYTPEGWRRVED